MHHFQYKGNELYAEEVAVKDIVASVGSPVYIYSHATFERHTAMTKLASFPIPSATP
jgi:diaminopimelate decarboxylase